MFYEISVCVCVCTHVPWKVDRGCGGQRATCRDWFSLSPWKFQGLNSGHSALLADPSDWPLNLLFSSFFLKDKRMSRELLMILTNLWDDEPRRQKKKNSTKQDTKATRFQ